MGEYYDKDKFTGSGGRTPPPNRPYRQPPPKKTNNSGWYSWPVIIILFSLGIWPVALILLLVNIFGEGQKRSPSSQSRSADEARSAVERAMRKAEDRTSRAEQKVERAFDRAGESVDQAVERAIEQMERTIDRTARKVEQTRSSSRRAAPPPQPKVRAAKPAKEKKQRSKPAGVALRIFGIVALFIGFCIGADFMSSVLQGYSTYWDDFFAAVGFLGAGGLMFFRGQYLNKMARRSQRYILAIGNVDAMPIHEIAKRVNRKPSQAVKELQKLIDKGYLGEDAYIDHEKGYFLRFGATLEEEEEEEEIPVREAPPTPKEAQEGYSGILRNIRHANDRIADPVLSRKIDRLEQVSGLIFKEVEEHPEKRSSIHTFFDYYLPTTQKLLDTYADFEETGVEGENLREAKERIEQTMDLIVAGFEHQLDQLYSTDAMDVASDIKVMEAMLKRDTASVARDFGFPETPKVRPKTDSEPPKGQTMQ
jgi:DNA-binding Lrp family transcriptional regulator